MAREGLDRRELTQQFTERDLDAEGLPGSLGEEERVEASSRKLTPVSRLATSMPDRSAKSPSKRSTSAGLPEVSRGWRAAVISSSWESGSTAGAGAAKRATGSTATPSTQWRLRSNG